MTICILILCLTNMYEKNDFSLNEKQRFGESMYLGVSGEECHLLTKPKYFFFKDLILKRINSLASDLKQLI